MAEVLAVHPNTVRFHLDLLEAAGAVERSDLRSGGRGRPSAVYSATPVTAWLGRRDPVLLCRILIDGTAGRTAEGVGVDVQEAGRRWGKERSTGAAPGAVREAISRHLDETGFEPMEEPGADFGNGQTRIALHNCAFADLVSTHQESVCSLHAGMLEGVREAVDVDQSWVVELRPFVEPFVCGVTVRGRGDAAGSS